MLLAVWGLDPDYILDHWTDELLDLMIDNLVKRQTQGEPKRPTPPGTQEVSEEEMFTHMGIKVVKG